MTTFDAKPFVRCLPGGLHDVVCPHCGPFAYGVRDYRTALRAASEHPKTCTTEEE